MERDRLTERETQQFMLDLVESVPVLQPLLDRHLNENSPDMLPHVLMWDVFQWGELELRAGRMGTTDPIARLVSFLKHGSTLPDGGPAADSVPNLIAVSFLENIASSPDTIEAWRTLLGPSMTAQLNSYGS